MCKILFYKGCYMYKVPYLIRAVTCIRSLIYEVWHVRSFADLASWRAFFCEFLTWPRNRLSPSFLTDVLTSLTSLAPSFLTDVLTFHTSLTFFPYRRSHVSHVSRLLSLQTFSRFSRLSHLLSLQTFSRFSRLSPSFLTDVLTFLTSLTSLAPSFLTSASHFLKHFTPLSFGEG